MTPVRKHPVWHQTPAMDTDNRPRPICVAETAAGLMLKLKGRRRVLCLPWARAWLAAARLAADAELATRQATRGSARRRRVRRGVLALA
jgi:hypothetical protein